MIPRLAETYPNAMVPMCKFTVGSSKTRHDPYAGTGPRDLFIIVQGLIAVIFERR
jgi:hypothetical protein